MAKNPIETTTQDDSREAAPKSKEASDSGASPANQQAQVNREKPWLKPGAARHSF